MSKKLIPEVRFEGFQGEWEEYKLSEISSKETEKNKDLLYSETFTNSATKGILSQTDYFINEITNTKNIDSYFIVKPDAFVYNPRMSVNAPVGPINRNKLKRTGVMSPLYYVFNVNKEKMNYDFLEWFFKTHNWHMFMFLNGNSGARSDRFSIKDADLEKMEITAPVDKFEQDIVGSYLKNLDKAVQFKENKIEKLQSFKQAMLQKMFPKEGETVPEIRFEGFEGEWELTNLGEYTSISTGSSDLQDSVPDGKYPFFVRSDDVQRSNRYLYDGEAILIPGEGRLGEIFHYINGKFDFHQRVYKISDFIKNDAIFTMYYMKRDFKSHALQKTAKATVDSLRMDVIKDFEIPLPSIEEQKQIGEYFEILDQNIQSKQAELEKLKQFKKAMLQKMFV